MRTIRKIQVVLLIFTILFSSFPAYAVDIVINADGTVNPGTYSDMMYAGLSGNSTSQVLGNNVNSIKTIDGGVSNTVYGVYANGANSVSADSIAGGIVINSTNGTAFGVYKKGTGGVTVSNVGSVEVYGNINAYGIYNWVTNWWEGAELSFSGIGCYINVVATNGEAYGIDAEKGKIVVTNIGKINVSGNDNVFGMAALTSSANPNVSFAYGGAINVTSTNGTAYGILGQSNSNITVTNLYGIKAETIAGTANGIVSGGQYEDYYMNVSFANGNYVNATSVSDSAQGISVYGRGRIAISNLYGVNTNGNTKACGILSEGHITSYSLNISFADGGYVNATSVNGSAYGIGDTEYSNVSTGSTVVSNVDGIMTNGYVKATGVCANGSSASFSNTVGFSGTGSYINAISAAGDAYGIELYGTGTTTVSNLGGIYANTSGDYQKAYGIYSCGSDTGFANNVSFSGVGSTINTSSNNSNAYGIYAAGAGTTTVSSLGGIIINGNGDSFCINNIEGTANIGFSGELSYLNVTSTTSGDARGISSCGSSATETADTTVYGLGGINANGNGSSNASGIRNKNGTANVSFTGAGSYINATSANGSAYGVSARATGVTTVTDLERITTAISGAYGNTSGIYINGSDANLSSSIIFCTAGGNINATGTADCISVKGIHAENAGSTTVTNLSGINAEVNGIYSNCRGVYSCGSDVDFNTNISFGGISSYINVSGEGTCTSVNGVYSSGVGTTIISGLGSIIATANNSSSTRAIYSKGESEDFNLSVAFAGVGSSINATSSRSVAYGIYGCGTGNTTVTNLGDIWITANESCRQGYGIYITAPYENSTYNVSFANSGKIQIIDNGVDTGIGSCNSKAGVRVNGSGATTVSNLGSIVATGIRDAYGVWTSSYGANVSTTVNFAGIGSYTNITSIDGNAAGIYAETNGTTTVTGLGGIEANASKNAYGIYSNGSDTGFANNVSFANTNPTIKATSASDYAYGIRAEGTGTTTVSNLGKIEASGSANVYGIYSSGSDANFSSNISFSGNGGQTITATSANTSNGYSIYVAGQGATTVNFENSILSGKIHQQDTASVTLNFGSNSSWTPTGSDVSGNVNVNMNSGSTLDTRATGKAQNKTIDLCMGTFTAQAGSKISFDAVTADNGLTTDQIKAASASSGTITLGSVNVKNTATSEWDDAKNANLFVDSVGAVLNDIAITGTTTTQTDNGYIYTFTGGTSGNVSATSKKTVTYTLPQIIQANPADAGKADTYAMKSDITLDSELGTLNNSYRSSGKPEFTINGNGSNLSANGYGSGVTINSGDTMNVKNIMVKGFSQFATNEGTLNLDGVTFTSTVGTVNVINNGTLNINSFTIFDKGIAGTGTTYVNVDTDMGNATITQGKTNVAADKTLTVVAANLKSNVTNSGTVKLGAGTLGSYNIEGGKVVTGGDVTANVENIKATGGITNRNVLTLTGNGTLAGSIYEKAGTTNISGTIATQAGRVIENAVTVNSGSDFTNNAMIKNSVLVKENSKLNNKGTITKDVALNSGATLSNSAVIKNNIVIGANSTLINNGIIGVVNFANSTTVTNSGTLTNDGTIWSKIINKAGSVFTSVGELKGDVINEGTLQLCKYSSLAQTVSGDGKIVVSAAGVENDTKQIQDITITKGNSLTTTEPLLGNITLESNTELTATKAGALLGGEGKKIIVKDDAKLTVLAGNINTDIYNNSVHSVHLTGGKLSQNIYLGGMAYIEGNVTFANEINVENKVRVGNGNSLSAANPFTLANTLTFEGGDKQSTVSNVSTTGTLAFVLTGANKNNAIVEATNGYKVTGAKLALYQDNKELYTKNDVVKLMKGAEGSYAGETLKAKYADDSILRYKYETYQEGDELLAKYIGKGMSDEAKSFSEGRLAGAAAITASSDLLAGEGLATAVAAAANSSNGTAPFVQIAGSYGKYNTGSHIDLNSTQVVAGIAQKLKDNITVGGYLEGGNGRYTSYNEFDTGEIRADGDINYFGAGVFGKYTFNKTERGNAYVDAAFGAGYTSQDYATDSAQLDSARYNASSPYLKAHATLGYKWKLTHGNIDGYAKYLWVHQNGDNVTLNAGVPIDFNSINSHRLRAGFRYTQAIKKTVAWYCGLAYEYEFDMSAGASSQGYAIAEPDLKGSSGMAELGLKFKPETAKGWQFDAGFQGFTGKRDSLGVRLGAWYEF